MERTTKTDPLTGLGSGHWLETERWPAALRSGGPLGIAYIDLDHLKSRNDNFGHAVGDLYIQEAAKALRQASRRGVDEIFRLYNAGDEFLVLVLGPHDPHRLAQTLIERLRSYGVAASVGMAYSTETGYLPARVELRQAAEAACRQAKAQGGDRAVVAPGADAAARSATLVGAAAAGAQTSDCTPQPIDDEATARLNPIQARHVQRLVAETARP
jgi:diguanylate cyclase (GGDEF)-like protein